MRRRRSAWLALLMLPAAGTACPRAHAGGPRRAAPVYAGRAPAPVKSGKDDQGLMYSVDGRFLVTGSGAVLAPADGKVLGQLTDEQGKPCKARNSMMAFQVDAKTGRILRTNQQCAPAWAGPPGTPERKGARP